jgi:type IV secretory pathway ATPase VirB11/archaellum biosynthesis ATPase
MARGSSPSPADDAASRYSATARAIYAPLGEAISACARKGRGITEFSINGPGDVWVRWAGRGWERLSRRESEFATEAYLWRLCEILAANIGIAFARSLPILACRTPDGHRFQAMLGPSARGGHVSIRIKRMVAATFEDFEVTPERRTLIEETVTDGKAILISGGTGSGKTTFQNMICRLIPMGNRVALIEDTPEVELIQPNRFAYTVSRIESGSDVTWHHVLDDVIRKNPASIVPGELSIANAFPFLQAMDLGHDSIITTMHANSARDALLGYRRRVALGGAAMTEVSSLLDFLAATVHLVVQIKHMHLGPEKERRVVTEVVAPRDLVATLDGGANRAALDGDARARDLMVSVAEARERVSGMLGGATLGELHEAALQVAAAVGLLDGGVERRRAPRTPREARAALADALGGMHRVDDRHEAMLRVLLASGVLAGTSSEGSGPEGSGEASGVDFSPEEKTLLAAGRLGLLVRPPREEGGNVPDLRDRHRPKGS